MLACEGSEASSPEIVLDPPEIVFSYKGGSQTVELHADCKWTAAVPGDAFFNLLPRHGDGDATLTIFVPEWEDYYDEWGNLKDEQAFVLVFTGSSDDRLIESRLIIRQTLPPGQVSIYDVRFQDKMTREYYTEGPLTPFRGVGWMTVEANNEWTMTCEPPTEGMRIDRGWPGVNEVFFGFPSNVSGETIEYHIKITCSTASGPGSDSLVLVQLPSEGSMSLLRISPSEDGRTIPAAGADLYLNVKSNTHWRVKTDSDFFIYGFGYDNEDTVVVHVPPLEEPGGRMIRLWLRLSELLDTNFIELEQR